MKSGERTPAQGTVAGQGSAGQGGRTPELRAAIDFGISNTDVVASVAGEWRRWTRPYVGEPTEAVVRDLLAAGGLSLDDLTVLAVTGGRHRLLPERLGATRLAPVAELPAIARGGQAALPHVSRRTRVLVVSAGSGTAVVAAQGRRFRHITGTGVGGGTMLGLGRLLLNTADPLEIDRLALEGNANAVDLSLADVVTGPIGTLPPTATAVNFGRLARTDLESSGATRADMAAALVTLVGQMIGLLAIAAARALNCKHIAIIGHMTDMASIRGVLELVSQYYSTPLFLPEQGGYFTAMGALLHAEEEDRSPRTLKSHPGGA